MPPADAVVVPAVLRTERLLLRPWRDADLAPFAALNADPVVRRFFPTVQDRAASDASARRVRAELDARGWGLWAVEAPGVAPFLGFVGLDPVEFQAAFTPAVEIGWRLARGFWGRGYATEAATAALAYAFDVVGLDEVVSLTAAVNTPSRRVMSKIGMTYDPADDFDHPRIPDGHPLRPHVLYRASRQG